MNRLVLASASPRRLQLLAQIGLEPDKVFAPNIDESAAPQESPRVYAQRMALAKLAACPHAAYVISADTVVAAGARILPKTENLHDAETCLCLLAGRRHRVYTAVAVRAPNGKVAARVVMSVVGFARLEAAQVQAYLASGEWQGKAGGYAIQGKAAAFIDFISGSYSGIVGLPLHETALLLRGLGYRP
ncbi:MAG: Maf family nucleotide pyrophosphatase [Acidocella sp.]|nr:Maf family nucleotide pyrophosphatase [Acidocella sp.]